MVSQKQLEANRRNARRSTGPRTAKGKSISKLNALRTGINAETEVLPDEDPAELAALAAEYEEFYKPSCPAERCCVAILVSADWRLRRFRRIEADLWDYESMEPGGARRNNGLTLWRCREPLSLLQRRIDSADRAFHRAIQRLDKIRSASATLDPAPAPAALPQAPAKSELAPEPENSNGFVHQFSICVTPDPAPPTSSSVHPSESLRGCAPSPPNYANSRSTLMCNAEHRE